ncbi:Ig-like domain repeat protein [Methanobrevibacter filiformis]|uniref:Putative outer membrane protein PmpI n=1 Tax=Methanobrevibacter filiformis TaxID=55758 RepID=A0A166A6F2_9EURY|nr:Ig-like domain repeat protein [Methanobrevibacter filiformis]KZX11634.1 putative outer membrane protein PmpI precursor [Methanobrevibacter filiformis]
MKFHNGFNFKKIVVLIIIILLPIFLVSGVSAADYILNPGDAGGINDAIATINSNPQSNDILTLNEGIYNKTNDIRNNITASVNLTIQGNGSPNSVIIDAGNLGGIFNISGTGSVTLTNLSFVNSSNDIGGAIYSRNSHVTIYNCNFIGNNATNGGAIYNNGTNFSVIDSVFKGNKGTIGCAIYNNGANFRVINSTFTDNINNQNGAIYNNNGTNFSVISSNFTDNTNNGGFVYNYYGANFSVINSHFSANKANNGGAIYNRYGANFSVINSSFINNTATNGGYGGAIFNNNGSNFTIINSSFINNTAANSGYGGAIYNNNGNNFTIINSSFINNAAANGGAIYTSGGANFTILLNSIFTGNNASSEGGAIRNSGGANFSVVDANFTDNKGYIGGAIINLNTNNFSVVDSIFTGNIATNGGAINNNGNSSNCRVLGSIFIGNGNGVGGAIYSAVNGGNFSVSNSSFSANNASSGTIYNYNGNFSVSNSSFIGNNASSYGGAIYNYNGTFSVSNSSFSANNANSYGGAIYNSGNFSLSNSSFSANNANGYGGAIYTINNTLSVSNSSFSGNIATHGGAIYTMNSVNFSVSNSSFINNTATNYGGVIYASNNFSVFNSTFINNSASFGGVIYGSGAGKSTANITVFNSSFVDNNAISSSYGGAIYNLGTLNINNSIFNSNNAYYGGGIYTSGDTVINNSEFINNSQAIGFSTTNLQIINTLIYNNTIAIQFCHNNSNISVNNFTINGTEIKDNNYSYGISGNYCNYTYLNESILDTYNTGFIIFTARPSVNTTGNRIINSNFSNLHGVVITVNTTAKNNTLYNLNLTNNNVSILVLGNNTTVLNSTITNNAVAINMTGYANNITGNNIFNNTYSIYSDAINSFINFNRIVNNPTGSSYYLINRGIGNDFNYNWWGRNTNISSLILNTGGTSVFGFWFVLTLYLNTPNNNASFVNRTEKYLKYYDFNLYYTLDLHAVDLDLNGPLNGINASRLPAFSVNLTLNSSGSNSSINQDWRNLYSSPTIQLTNSSPNATLFGTIDYENIYLSLEGVDPVLDLYVNSTGGNDDNNGTSWEYALQSIGTALNLISSGGTIHIATGNYNNNYIPNNGFLMANTNLTISKNLTFIAYTSLGENPVDHEVDVVIDALGNSTIFYLGSNVYVNFTNMSFVNANGANGGGIYGGSTTNITVINSKFTNNTVSVSGGAIYGSGVLTVINSSFINNTATSQGGAIRATGPSFILNNSNFSDNYASSGGAIHNGGSNGLIYNSIFNNNSATQGGAIRHTTNNLTIYNSNFTNNKIQETINNNGGGAIWSGGSTLTINVSYFENNSANGTGSNTGGGAIYNTVTKTVINNSTFINNSATGNSNANGYGGAIYNYNVADFKITNSSFKNNNVSNYGAAIYNTGTNFNVNNSIFDSNYARYGGTIYNTANNFTVLQSNFTNNTANLGAAIYNTAGTNFKVNNSNFINNTATSNAGAIYNTGAANFTITESNFVNNSAQGIGTNNGGGAVYITGNNSNNFTIKNSKFINNHADDDGGAIYQQLSLNLTILNSEFTNNSANNNGGAIYNNGTYFNLNNSNFTNNSAPLGGAIFLDRSNQIGLAYIGSGNGDYAYGYAGSFSFVGAGNGDYTNTINNYTSSNRYFYVGSGNGNYTASTLGSLFLISVGNGNGDYGNIILPNNFRANNSNFTNNSASIGGAIFSKATNSSVTNSNFENNTQGFATNLTDFNLIDNNFKNNGIAVEFVFSNINYTIEGLMTGLNNNVITDNVHAIGISGNNSNYIVNESYINHLNNINNLNGFIFTQYSNNNTILNSTISNYTSGVAITMDGINNSIINSNITNNSIAILILGNKSNAKGSNILNNHDAIIVNLTAKDSVINYNRFVNNTLALNNSGINTNANLNWWGNNIPLVNGINLSNWFVIELSANLYNTIINSTHYTSSGVVNLSYKFLLYNNLSNTTSFVDYGVLPFFLVNINWNYTINVTTTTTNGTIHSLNGVEQRGNYSYNVNLTSGTSYSLEAVGDNENIVLNLSMLLNLSILKVANVTNVLNNDTINFTITITNNGNDLASNVTFTNFVGDNFKLLNVTGGLSYNNTTGIWAVGDIAGKTSVTLHMIVQAIKSGTINSTAFNVTAIEALVDPSINSTVTITILPAVNLNITKISNVTNVTGFNIAHVGDHVKYIINVKNNGLDNASSVHVYDILDSKLTYIRYNSSTGTYNNNTGLWNIGTLHVNQTATLEIEVIIANIGTIENIANVTANEIILNGSNINTSTTIHIEPLNTTLVINPIVDTKVNSNVSINGTLLDERGAPIGGVTINLVVNGVNYTATTNASGKWSITYHVGLTGVINVVAEFVGNANYIASANATYFEGLALNSTLVINPIVDTKVNSNVSINGTLLDERGAPIGGVTINLVVNGVNYTATTDTSGKWSITYHVGLTGLINVEALFVGDANYIASANATYFEGLALNSTLVINPIADTNVNSSVSINGTLLDERGVPIGGVTVIVTVNGVNYNVTTDASGKWSITYLVNSKELVNVVAEFVGNSNYAATANITYFNGVPLNSTLVINPISYTKTNTNVSINGTLFGENNSVISNVTVVVTVNGVSYNVTTDASGKWSITYLVNSTGLFNVVAVFNGNNIRAAAVNSTNFIGVSLNSTLIINHVLDTKVNSSVSINGTLLDENNNVIANVMVVVTVNGVNYNVTTDVNGNWNISYLVNSTGNINVVAEFNGNTLYAAAVNSTSFNGLALNSTLIINHVSNAKVNSNISINGTLLDGANNAIANVMIVVTVNGVNYNATTDDSGKWSITYLVNSSGNINVVAEFSGNTLYAAAVNSTSFNGLALNSTLVINPILNVKMNSSVSINGTLLDENNKAISNVMVVVTVNGINYNTTTDASGKWNINYPVNSTGFVDVVAVFNGNNRYVSATNSTTFIVPNNVNISIIKIANINGINNSANAHFGDTVIYTISVVNNGATTATGVLVTEIINNTKLKLNKASTTQGSYSTVNGLWTIGELAAGKTVTLTINATIIAIGNISNSANVSASENNINSNNKNTVNISVNDVNISMIMISNVTLQNNPHYGDIVTYKIIITNNGITDGHGVNITDILGDKLKFINYTTTDGSTYDKNAGIWSIGTLKAGNNLTLTITAKINDLGEIENIAKINTNESNINNKTNDSIKFTVNDVNLTIVKTSNITGNPLVEDYITYTIKITNNGLNTASNFNVLEKLNSKLQFISYSSNIGTYNNITGLWNISTLSSGKTATLTINAKIISVGTIKNTATINTNTNNNNNNNNTNNIGNNNSSISIISEAIPSQIHTLNVIATVDNSVKLESILKDSNGKPITDKEVKFYVNGKLIGTAKTNVKGVAYFSYTPTKTGTLTYTSSFNDPAGVYAASTSSKSTVTVTKDKITLNTKLPTGTVGDKKTIKVKATNSEGKVVPNKTFTVYINGKKIGNYKTNSKGEFTIKTTIKSSNKLQIKFAGDNKYNKLSKTYTYKEKSKEKTITTIYYTKTKYDKVTILKAKLIDAKGKVLAGKYIKFYVAGKYVGKAKTNKKGIAILKYTPEKKK